MKRLLITSVFLIQCILGFSQIKTTPLEVNLDTPDKETEITPEPEPIPEILDAQYKGGIINFYSYLSNNFNFNNVKAEDITEKYKGKDIMIIFVQFTINEEGKPNEFKPLNTTAENSFFVEAARVIGSSRWKPATQNEIAIKQMFNIPIQAYIKDL